jgi:YD repeat-containing protein
VLVSALRSPRRLTLALLAVSSSLLLVGCGGATHSPVPQLVLSPGEHVTSPQEHDPLRQAVAVAFLDPETEIAVDVVSGKLYVPIAELPTSYGEKEGLIGLEDPELHHTIFAYTGGGIPGRPAWNRHLGRAAVPAAGHIPLWMPPRLVVRAGRPVEVVLADGRSVRISSDAHRRLTEVQWPSPQGQLLATTIRYALGMTAVRGPTGVVRVYHYDRRSLITEVDAPGAAAHARQDAAQGVLDNEASAKRIGERMHYGAPARAAVWRVAPTAIGADFRDFPSSGGYQHYGVNSIGAMRVVDHSLERSGVLDIAEAIPVLDTEQQLYGEEGALNRLTDLMKPCHLEISWGEGLDSLEISISRTITAKEVEALDRGLSKVPIWVDIYYGARNLCAHPD